ncbi:hypothetical protein [Pseudoalteromonas phage C7]|uniref:hypothetical protein n=1 Tax=Pseudoalteromonas phage C7 TaxID=2510494 RepID=UPI00101779CA|nr:hypothetical protein PP587_gp33 [Pseudoalteromonas phage C7]QAY17987.1 hypothetical protein [Pseudoalteromonas phage C7]
MRVILISNTNKATVTKKDGVYNIKGIPITVNNSTMNRVLYPEDENAKGMPTMNGKPLSMSHPSNEDGQNVSIFSPEGIDFYSGGKVAQTYSKNGIWYADADINEKRLKATEQGEYFANRLDDGLPIGVSTGLLFEANNESGDGYDMVARNMEFDHLAMLHESEAPAGGDATVMRFNGEDVNVVNFDDFEPLATNDKKGLYAWLESKIDSLITNRYNNQDENINVNDKGPEMELKEVEQLLQANNDTQNKALADIVATAVNSAVEPLKAELETVKASVTANADKEKAKLVTRVNALELGLDSDIVAAMNAEQLTKLLAKHEGKPAGGVNTNSRHTEEKPFERHAFKAKGAK